MAAVGGDNFMRYIYRGEEGEIIPREATHITVAEDCTVVRAFAFYEHPNIVEIICHEKVERIGQRAFRCCPSLRRVVMPGVTFADERAFCECHVLTDVECGKLERMRGCAFDDCESLRSINLPSARTVSEHVFCNCTALVDVKFGSKLERLEDGIFVNCPSFERITIPLKDCIIYDDSFQDCGNLKHVDLVEGAELREIIAALLLEDWRNDMNEEIDSINHILPNARAGYWADNFEGDDGEKAQVIRTWIRSVLRKIIHYQAEHQHVLNVATTTLKLALPHDIVNRSILPFLELPSHTFELAEGGDEDDDEVSYSEGSSSEEEESSEEGESGMEEESSNDDEVPSKRQRIQDR